MVQSNSVFKIPSKCAIIARSFEISKISDSFGITGTMELDQVERITVHQMANKSKIMTNKNLTDLSTTGNEIETNNNATIKELKSISFESYTTREKMLISTTSSTVILLSIVVTIVLTVICMKKCKKKGESSPVINVVIDKSELSKNSNFNPEIDQLLDQQNVQNSNSANSIQNDVGSEKLDKQKPPFQQRR